MSNEKMDALKPDLEDLRGKRWDAIRELSNIVEMGGPGRVVQSTENTALEEDLKAFTPGERTGFMEMRNVDLQRILEDLNEQSSVKAVGKTKEYPNESGDTLRIEWDGNGLRLISEWNDGDGGTKETSDPDEIAEHHDMLSLISVYRDAQESMEKELTADFGE
ncbi:MAG: hypothetical protein HGA31_03730 [Candidatus Moranbacteria bacterium]|nr:hypothetical protein [Candidatus Moranbacteria bacterium]